MIGRIHPSPDTNKRLFINTTYWEFLNETIPVRMSRGDEWGGSFVAFCFQFKSRVQPKKRPLMGNIKQSLFFFICHTTITKTLGLS